MRFTYTGKPLGKGSGQPTRLASLAAPIALVLLFSSLVQARPQLKPQPLKALAASSLLAKQFAHDVGHVRVLILASPT